MFVLIGELSELDPFMLELMNYDNVYNFLLYNI